MNRLQRRSFEISRQRNLQEIRQIARRTRRVLLALMALLILLIIVLTYRLGSDLWPAWLLQERRTFMGLLGLGLMGLVLFAPVIIEADSNPQPFVNLRRGNYW